MSVDHSADFVKLQNVTSDAFLGGRLAIMQPTSGFRAGVDSVLLGAAVSPQTTAIADFGAGVGVAGLTAATLQPAASLLLVEQSAEMRALAQTNIGQNRFEPRASTALCDVTGSGPHRSSAGLLQNHYTSIIANPPYFANGEGTLASEPTRAGSRHMPSSTIDAWLRAAAGAAAAKGEVIFIYRADGLPDLLEAFNKRLGGICVLPIAGRAGEDAGRVLLRGIKGSRAPLRLLAPLVLHEETGNHFQPDVARILRGEARLVW